LEFSKGWGIGYLQIPNFIPQGQDMWLTASIGLGFYIKIDKILTEFTDIFSYWSNQNSAYPYPFALQINSDLKLKTFIGPSTALLSQSLTLGKWASVYIMYSFTAGGYGLSRAYINGIDAGGLAETTNGLAHSQFSTADILRVGGFVGHLKRLQIFSPAAIGMNKGMNLCNPNSCLAEIGFNEIPVCMSAVCDNPKGYYSSFGTCEPCPERCETCTDPSTCKTCKSAHYLLDGACLRCPMHCESCTDAQTCQTCGSGLGLYNKLCMLCPIGTYLGSDQICRELSKALQDTLTNSQLANSAANQIANALSKGSSVSLSAMVGGKIFFQIKYLNISYSGELQTALLTWLPGFVSLGLTPDMPDSIRDKIPDRHVPYVFEKYEVPSSFLVNFWESLGAVLFVATLWLIFRGMEFMMSPQKYPKPASFVKKARTFIQNYLIAALCGVYGDVVLYGIIEYRTFVFGWNLSLLSLIISVILLITMFICFFYQFRLLVAYQRIKKQEHPSHVEEFKKRHEGSQVFFKDVKDDLLSQQLFIFFLTMRDIILSFILATMFEYPLAQTVIITLLNCLMIVYLFIKRPFGSKFDFAQQLFFEFVGLGVMISVVINAVFDAGKYEAHQGRKNIGKLLMIANMMFNFVTAIFMLIIIVQSLIECYKERKQIHAKILKAFHLQNRLQSLPPTHPPLNTSQISLKNEKTPNSEAGLLQSNILSNISFHQESFDFGYHPSASQSIPQILNNSGQQRPLNPSLLLQSPESQFNHDHQVAEHQNILRINSRKNPTKPRSQIRQPPRDVRRMPETLLQPNTLSNLPQEARPRR